MQESRVEVRQQTVPGHGQRFLVGLGDGAEVTVTVETRTGARRLGVLRSGHDRPETSLELTEAQAETVGTLLSGVHLAVEPLDAPTDGVSVATVLIGAGSPAVGRALAAIEVPDPEQARIIAVIRDDTPELLEEDPARPCAPGDRLVLAGRPDALRALRVHLNG